MLVIFSKGGYFMWPILLCSIISLAVILERIFVMQRKKFFPEVFTIEMEELIKQERFSDAVTACKKSQTVLSKILLKPLQDKKNDFEKLKSLVNEYGEREVEYVARPLQILSTIASISPLLGLLGTVAGMIKVFSVISVEGVGNPASLASGISEALFTTAAGLLVAIPTFVAYKYFQSKLKNYSMILEEESLYLLNIMHEGRNN